MPHVRRNVWKLPPGDSTLEWYGRAVEELQKRSFDDATSWWSLAAMHGIQEDIWRNFGFITPHTVMPTPQIQQSLWRQCQHLTWYFLPWHRGYLASFEAIIRDTIIKLGGPAGWALPYWNYSDDPAALELPRAFAMPTLPVGGKNFLHVARRYGLAEFPNIQNPIKLLPAFATTTRAMAERRYEGTSIVPGFGGIKTPFWHGDETDDGVLGVLENEPHGGVHVLVGGGFRSGRVSDNPLEWGLMTNPDTAALDPIFWLHHANIDRLWNVWLRQKKSPGDPPDAFSNPVDTDWLNGPFDRKYAIPRTDGTLEGFIAREMLDTTVPKLDYIYDDEVPLTLLTDQLARRVEQLGATPELAEQFAGAADMSASGPLELLGANTDLVRLVEDVVETRIRLDGSQRQHLFDSLAVKPFAAGEAPTPPDRVYLNLENIRSPSDAAAYYVYVNLPAGTDHFEHPELLAGTLSMFGVSKASSSAGGGNGVNASYDITSIIDRMFVSNTLGNDLSVKLITAVPGTTGGDISIGRVSIYRQGQ